MMTTQFCTSDVTVTFAVETGQILSVSRHGKELAVPAATPFTLQFRDLKGELTHLCGADFANCTYQDNCFLFTGCTVMPTLKIELRIRIRGQYIALSNAVSGVPADQALAWIDAPQLHISAKQTIFHPYFDGIIVTDPELREKSKNTKYHPIEFAKRGQGFGAMYPGRCMMQFLAAYGKDGGVFFAAFDQNSIPKAVEYAPLHDGTVRLSLQTFTGCGFGSGYSTPFEYVLTGFDGDWMRAASLYRDWYDSHAPVPAPFPKLIEDSPVTVIYPVLGTGMDHGKHQLHPNCYYPYSNALPFLRKLRRQLDSPIMALLMHWEGTAPWAPPYVWPPLGGEQLLADFRDELHKEGNYLGLYCSGTAWTQTSSITDYSQEERCRKENLERFMLCGPKGELDAVVCNGPESQRLGYDLCLTEGWSRKQIREEIQKITQFGTDYCQFFDQNHGGGQHICYSQNHCHPPVPGPAQTESMRSLLTECTEDIKALGSEMVLGCESSAAEPFVQYLLLNDARACFTWFYGQPVPAQSFVFHGRTVCFAGNQGGVSGNVKYLECPECVLYFIAYAFHAGDLLSVVLKEDGIIHWCWAVKWEVVAPEQESILTLIRNLNILRRRYPQYLLYGRMLEPLHNVKCESWNIILSNRSMELPKVLHTSWEAPDGEKAQFLVNYFPYEQTVTAGEKTVAIPPLSAIILPSEKNG
ncbi:MAG: hypothetical protein GX927_10600 [Lentisphaerae bacterium]|jgi:hypothetical protein|nr:hypothetical protein [Lentisphaerota bacterium]